MTDQEPTPPVPDVVAAIAGDRPLQLVWNNAIDGLTYQVGVVPDRLFVKWLPRRSGVTVTGEATRLRWAIRYIAVPRIRSTGCDAEATWMVTEGLPGENAVCDRWQAEPETAAVAIGRGLRRMHDALPVADCPFSWSAEKRLAGARRRAELGLLEVADWHEDHRALGVAGALARLERPPAVDQLVVCHGDACSPNTLIGEDGACAGHTDLGALGIADRWADLAIATWATTWNYGEGFEDLLLEAYGVGPDPVRSAYYRLLWDLDV